MSLLQTISKGVGKVTIQLSKHAPEILIGVGIVGFGGCVMTACRNTIKCKDELDEKKEELAAVRDRKDDFETEKEYNKEITTLHIQRLGIVVRNYAAPVIIGGLAVSCVLYSHHILAKRNAALMAAYAAVDKAFKEYRKRVKDELGEDKDREFLYGMKKVKKLDMIEVNENGEEVTKKADGTVIDPNLYSQYAVFFDEASPCWQKSAEYNKSFLVSIQNNMNDMLHARGHVFLNEVYDAIGVPRTQAGAVVGWVLGAGDDFIDFSIFDIANERKRSFVNGFERSILLDFNVDGVIFDKI